MFDNNEKGNITDVEEGLSPFFKNTKKGDSPNLEEENILRRIPIEITALSVLIALVAVPLFDPLTGLIVLAGGALAALSFLWLKQTVSRALQFKNGGSPSKGKAIRSTLAFYILRIVLILGIFFIIIFFFSNKILAFVVGFSTLVPVFLAEAAIALSKMKQWKS